MSATGIGAGGLCGEIQERLSEVLDGAAPAKLYEHIAECDTCRDLRYEAGRAAELVAGAGGDVSAPSGYATQVRERVMTAAEAVAPPRAEASSSRQPAKAASEEPSIVVPAGLPSAGPEHTTNPTVLAPTVSMKTQPSVEPAAEGVKPILAGEAVPVPVPVPVSVSVPVPVPVPADAAAAAPVAAPAAAPVAAPAAAPVAASATVAASASAPEPVAPTRADSEPPAAARAAEPKPASARPAARVEAAAADLRAKPDAKASDAAKATPRPRRTRLIAVAAGALALAAGAGIFWKVKLSDSGPSSAVVNKGPWWGKVTSISRASQDKSGGLEVCDAAGACSQIAAGTDVRNGSTLRTDSRTRAFLALTDGTEIAIDRATHITLTKGQNRTASVEQGTIVADITQAAPAAAGGWPARFTLPQGEVEVLGTKLAITASDSRASVEVARGAARVRGRSGKDVEVRAGEEATVDQGGEPQLASTSSLADTMEWSDRTPEEVDAPVLRGVGELRAKKPGQTNEKDRAVRLAKHAVKVRIVDVVARTEVDETFANDTDEELEGIFRFPLPPGAQIERLALEVEGKLMEGAFVDRDKGAAIWRGVIQNAAPKAPKTKEEILWVPGPWRDPALLEWQRGGRFELKIFPIPKRGSRRVVLTYTELVGQSGGTRRFTYPLAHDPNGTTKIDSFDMDLQVLGLDKSAGISARGYELVSAAGEGERRTMHADAFIPAGDLTVEYALPDRSKEVTAWAYRMDPSAAPVSPDAAAIDKSAPKKGKTAEEKAAADVAAAIADDASPYVAIAVRPKLPRWQEAKERTFAIVVDTSRSMIGERYARATRLASSLVREMDRRDSFVLLACDTICRSMPADTSEAASGRGQGSGRRAEAAFIGQPGAAAAANVERFLGSIEPDGGSDLAASVNAARAAAGAASGKELRILYLGDGTPTVGPTKPSHLEVAVRGFLPPGDAAVIAVALGADADMTSLGALARGGGGVVVPYVPGQKVSSAALDILGTAYGVLLRDAALELPPGLTQVSPARLDPIRAGGETIVVARMSGGSDVNGAVKLTGRVAGERFEQTYPLKVVATSSAGNAFVPRLYAAAKIAELEQTAGDVQKSTIIELSKRFAVASRYTSLLVLESEAMFKAFGLDRISTAPSFTGEQLAESSTADAEGVEGDDEVAAEGKAKEEAAFGPSPAATAAAPRSVGGGAAKPDFNFDGAPSRPAPAPKAAQVPTDSLNESWSRPRRPPQRLVPMRRVFDRKVTFDAQNTFVSQNSAKLIAAESALAQKPDSRDKTKELYALYATSGRLGEAQELTAKWSGRDALDPDALIARADLAARQGDRDRAARILGGLSDVRPGDRATPTRLAKLHDAAGSPALACEHRIALADLAPGEAAFVADAARCARAQGMTDLASLLVSDAAAKVREAVDRLLAAPAPSPATLQGDVQISADWSGSADLDIALIDSQGRRTSWLGTTSKATITARDATSQRTEALAVSGLTQGNYVVEIVRASGDEGNVPIRGDVTLRLGNETRKASFNLTGPRAEVGTVRVFFTSRLVPIEFGWP